MIGVPGGGMRRMRSMSPACISVDRAPRRMAKGHFGADKAGAGSSHS
jgi:hypothetical protein